MVSTIQRTVASGSTDTFSIPFPKLDRTHVQIRLGGVLQVVTTDYTWPTDSTIQMVAGNPAAGTVVERRRVTPTGPIAAFSPGNLDTTDLNVSALQPLYVAQEAADAEADLDARAIRLSPLSGLTFSAMPNPVEGNALGFSGGQPVMLPVDAGAINVAIGIVEGLRDDTQDIKDLAALDRAATGADSAATAGDRVQTGLDRAATAADIITGAQALLAAEAARDASLYGKGIFPTTAAAIGLGIVATGAITPGATGTDGTFALAFTGGTGSGAAGRFVVAGGVLTQVVITAPGSYTVAPTLSFAASAGLAGAAAVAVLGVNAAVGEYFWAPVDSVLGLYNVSAGPVAADTGKRTLDPGTLSTTLTETRGRTVTPIAGTALPTPLKYLILDAFTHAGLLKSVKFPATATGTLTIERWNAAHVYQETRTITVASTGNKAYVEADLSAPMTINVGDFLSVKPSVTGVGAYTAGQPGDGLGYVPLTAGVTSWDGVTPAIVTTTRLEFLGGIEYDVQTVTSAAFATVTANADRAAVVDKRPWPASLGGIFATEVDADSRVFRGRNVDGSNYPSAEAAALDTLLPSDTRLGVYGYSGIAERSGTRLRLLRPIDDSVASTAVNLDGLAHSYRHASPGSIVGIETDADYAGFDFTFNNLVANPTSTDPVNYVGGILVDGVLTTTISNPSPGTTLPSSASVPVPSDGAIHRVEMVMPNGGGVDLNKVKVTRGAGVVPATRRAIRYVAAGDSITQGFLATDIFHTWPWLFANLKSWELAANLGFGLRKCVAADGSALAGTGANIVTYLIGANDSLGGTTLSAQQAKLQAWMVNARAALPSAKLVLITPLWANAAYTNHQNMRDAMTAAFAALADANSQLIDGLAAMPNSAGQLQDTLHPNNTGAASIAAYLNANVSYP